jgi:hypothetical protein
MTSQNLHHAGGFVEAMDSEAKWQKHVVVALWLLIGLSAWSRPTSPDEIRKLRLRQAKYFRPNFHSGAE